MCGRFVVIPDTLKARFDIWGNIVKIQPNYNASPGQHLPIILKQDNHNIFELMEWGLVPHWVRERKTGFSMINARMETLLEKLTFKYPFRTQRCIIPANGFYEWKQTDTGKIPHFIHLPNHEMMGFAGLYDTWEDKTTGNSTKTYTIITTASSGIMESIHNRTPVILKQELENDWLTNINENDLYNILEQNKKEIEMYPVSMLVNTPRNNNASLIQPVRV